MHKHVVQSPEWAKVKNEYGTPAIWSGTIFYTKHKIPLLNLYYGYCPRVNPFEVDFEALKTSLHENACIGLLFDVPNIYKGSKEEETAKKLFEIHCRKSTRSEFAKGNFIIDLTKTERELFESMNTKHRYNVRQAAKKGVEIRLANNNEDFDIFYKMLQETAIRQKYFIRPKKYYQIVWDQLHPLGMCDILMAQYEHQVLATWMVFVYEDVLYYPYGGSSIDHKNVFCSNALGWEVIRYGKSKGCKLFDMWGAAEDPTDPTDPYYGFTNFKAKFGGTHVRYIESYDLVINKIWYMVFNLVNKLRWKLLEQGLIK